MRKMFLSLLVLGILVISGQVRSGDTPVKDAKITTISVEGMT